MTKGQSGKNARNSVSKATWHLYTSSQRRHAPLESCAAVEPPPPPRLKASVDLPCAARVQAFFLTFIVETRMNQG